MLKLYIIAGACSLASNIALREAGIRFALIKVDAPTRRTEDGTDYLSVNSKGYVPALELDDGQVLTEGVAVLQYIADLNPASGLAPPAQSFERYRLQEWLCFINSELHKPFSPLFDLDAAPAVHEFARSSIARRLDWAEAHFGPGRFLMGARFTVADAYLFTVLSWAPEAGISLNRWPALADHQARVRTRPMVAAALEAEA